jgi:hypothetical protein
LGLDHTAGTAKQIQRKPISSNTAGAHYRYILQVKVINRW